MYLSLNERFKIILKQNCKEITWILTVQNAFLIIYRGLTENEN